LIEDIDLIFTISGVIKNMERNQLVILSINPGSTHDEVALFIGESQVFKLTISYSIEDLKPFEEKNVTSQYEYRKNFIKNSLIEHGIDLSKIDAVAGRGGLLRPIPGGVFLINDEMLEDLEDARYGDHPSNLGAMLAYAVGKAFNKPAFIADSVVTDELWDIARYTGIPEITRRSVFHCLNQKKVGYMAAERLGKHYSECNLIIAHSGGGVTIGAHYQGRVVDVNSGIDGDGPFTPQRAGSVPALGIAKLALSGKYTYDDMKVMVTRRGGLRAYTGTSDIRTIKKYIKGEPLPDGHDLDTSKVTPQQAREVLESMCYNIGKEICSLSAAFCGNVDAIVITGGIAYDEEFSVPWISQRVGWIAPIMVFPGGDELKALRDAVERVMLGLEIPKCYKSCQEAAF
jgi:butyrate kinase